jgi:transcription elongation factor GreA
MTEKEYLTQEKFQELEKELNFLKNTRRKEIALELEYAKSLGDLSENAEYNEARENQATVEARIRRIEHILKNAEIVSPGKGEVVEVGSTVLVEKEGEKEKRTYSIVGSEEADGLQGKISYQSPLGKALMHRKKGGEATLQIPSGEKVRYKIIDVS